MHAKIMRYRVPRSMKKALFIKNGSVNSCIAIHLNKTFTEQDAKQIIEKIASGSF